MVLSNTESREMNIIKKKEKSSKKIGPFYFLSPTVIILVVITIFPTFYGMWLSFQHIPRSGLKDIGFIGLKNYSSLLTDGRVWESLQVTLIYIFFTVMISTILGFLIATLINRRIIGKQVLLSLFILPITATPVVVGLIWRFMFMSDLGTINYFLSLLKIPQINWLSNPLTALIAVITVDVWQWTPFCMIFLLAGLQNLPKEPYEAAYIDGANKSQVFRYITFPQLVPITAVVVLIRLIDSFKAFDIIYIMTEGGPGRATQTLNLLAYQIGFKYFDLTKMAAFGVLALILIIFLSTAVLKIFKTE